MVGLIVVDDIPPRGSLLTSSALPGESVVAQKDHIMGNIQPYYYVTTPDERPDYRTIKAFLWDDDRNCDGDGNAYPASSRVWTELMLEPRDMKGERFDVVPHIVDPLTLKIYADTETLAARVAYILAHTTGGRVAQSPEGPFDEPQALLATVGNFDVVAALSRFENSPFAKSTLENPYPNLNT